jgi:hypothetical protein
MRPRRRASYRAIVKKIGNTINQLDLLHRLFINHGHYGVIPEGRAGRVAAGGSLTPNHGVVPTIGKMRHVHAWFAPHLSSQFNPYTAERL